MFKRTVLPALIGPLTPPGCRHVVDFTSNPFSRLNSSPNMALVSSEAALVNDYYVSEQRGKINVRVTHLDTQDGQQIIQNFSLNVYIYITSRTPRFRCWDVMGPNAALSWRTFESWVPPMQRPLITASSPSEARLLTRSENQLISRPTTIVRRPP